MYCNTHFNFTEILYEAEKIEAKNRIESPKTGKAVSKELAPRNITVNTIVVNNG